jgi:hypothetical protein
MCILEHTGSSLVAGDEFAVLAQNLAEAHHDTGDEPLRSKILRDSCRDQGIIGSYINNEKGYPRTLEWLNILQSQSLGEDPPEAKLLHCVAYTELGRAALRHSKDEAMACWKRAADGIDEIRLKSGKLPFSLPWYHRALVHVFNGEADRADDLFTPIIKDIESKPEEYAFKTYE